ncbi:MAG: fibronectin type III domain-containing protein [Candidatus Moraniibacteriota bacterium]|nr:MAG: fibronectin type III domain-containing protein [Candidatus Moranbacteria bacterium]
MFQKHKKRIFFFFAFLTLGLFTIPQNSHASTVTWTGTTSTAWTTVTNWNTGTVPTSTDDVVINYTGTNQPTLDVNGGTITIQSLTLGGGASTSTLTMSNGYNGNDTNKKLNVTGNVTILNNGYLTHTANSSAETHRLFMDIGGNLDVQTGGQINVDRKGYGTGYGPGYCGERGAYGGQSENVSCLTYGSIMNPINLGSDSGGGAVILNIFGVTTLNGTISSSSFDAYRGSGGGVNIITHILNGSGSIKTTAMSRSGGGRIAVKLTSGNDFGSVVMQAYGAAAGTIYTETASQGTGNGAVTIDNNNQTSSVFTAIPSTQTWTIKNLVVKNRGKISVPTGTTLILDNPDSVTGLSGVSAIESGIALRGGIFDLPQGSLTIENWALIADLPHTLNGDITVKSGGYMTHSANTNTEAYKMNLTINGNLDVQTGGQINVDRKGYGTGYGPGYCGERGAYGGQSENVSCLTYGSIMNPINLGSDSGGGAVILNIFGVTTLNGTISSSSFDAYRGSGGGVNIITHILNGSGSIKTTAMSRSGGGRIAVKLTSGNDFGSVVMQAYGAAAGTIYTETASQGTGNGAVTIDNNNQTSSVFTAIPSTQTWTIKNLVVKNRGKISVPTGTTLILDNPDSVTGLSGVSAIESGIALRGGIFDLPQGSLTIENWALIADLPHTLNGDITVKSGGYMTHSANTNTEAYKMNLTINGNLDVQTGGQINVDGKGYGIGSGPGYCTSTGSYGGQSTSSCSTYGSILNPINLGSGSHNPPAGGGGGAIILNVSGNSLINGLVSSNGEPVNNNGGSGGSVNINTSLFVGSGAVRSNGNRLSGGGRIAVKLTSGNDFGSVTMQAYGGSSGAAAGTIYTQTASQGSNNGTLTIDNNNQTATVQTLIPQDNFTNNSLSLGNIIVKNKGLLAIPTGTTLNTTGDITIGTLNSSTDTSHIVANGTGTLISTNLTIHGVSGTGASINTNTKGYTPTLGTGAGTTGSLGYGSGGTYGGRGGNSSDGATSPNTYGNDFVPEDLGSGGGKSTGGTGGGDIRIRTNNNLNLYGTISSNGSAGLTNGGGGSGGSINILYAKNFTINGGKLQANGGAGQGGGGGGGGGRIAYAYENKTFTNQTIQTLGGTKGATAPATDGSAGSLKSGYLAGSLISSAFDSSSDANVMGTIEWKENEILPTGSSVTLSLKTAGTKGNLSSSPWIQIAQSTPSSLTTHCTKNNTTVSCTASAIPQDMKDIFEDRFFQYKVDLSSPDLLSQPQVDDVKVGYVVNAFPMIQNVTTTPNTDKTVTITYETKDEDTNTGTNTPGIVTPSFEYYNGSSWINIASNTLAPEDIQNKTVNQDTYTTHSATWTPSLVSESFYLTNAKIRVTVSDNEGANNIARAESNTFTLDTKTPTNPSLLVDASTQDLTIPSTTSVLTLGVSDDSPTQMKISLDENLTNSPWEPFNATVTIKLETDPDIVYTRFKDQYGNETQTIHTTTPETPTRVISQDTSNMLLTPPEYRAFVGFKTIEEPPTGFGNYKLYRSDDATTYTLQNIITSRTTNFLTDATPQPDILYTYKAKTTDTPGNVSFFSQTVTMKANGIQDFGEGGGGSDQTPPVLQNVTVESKDTTTVTITWETDELSDSRVEYATTPNTYTKQTGVSTYADTQAQSGLHRVTLTNLTPNTPYFFRVASTDPQGNTGVNDNNGNGYEVTTNPGPSISGVAVSSASNTQATIFWNTNVPADSVLHYSENKNGSLIDPITLSGSSVLTKNHQVTLDALTQGTTYYFYVTSTDSQGNIANDNNGGNYFQFSTTLDETPPTITNLQTSLISNDKAVITANTDEEASFLLQYRKKGSLTFTQTEQGTTYDRSHYRVLDTLTPDTEYEYQVSVKDINQNESQSDIQTMKTTLDPEYNHAPLSKIHTISDPPKVLTDQKAVITFQTDQAANCILEYGTQSRNYQEVPQTEATGIYDTLHSLHLGGLIFNTTYFYKLLCEDNLGTLIESEEKSFTTKLKQVDSGSEQAESTPPSISGVKVKDITGESAVVSWETDEVGNSLVSYGSVKEYGNMAGDDLVNKNPTKFSTAHSVTLRGLIPSTKYYYSALSYDTAGNIGTSSQQTFQTQSPSSISSIKASSKQIGETTITWKTSTPTTSIVEYGNTENYGQTRKSEELKKDHEIIINNLLENSTYHFRVKGEDESKNLFSSSDSTFEPKSPPQIKEIKIEVLSDREAKVNFLTDTLTDSLVTYKNKNKEEDQKSEGNPSLLQTHSLTLKELTPGENYVLTVRVRDDMGNETLSDEIEFTMQKDETSPTVERVSTDSALSQNGKVQMIINWQTDEDASSSLIYKEGRAGEEKTVNVSSSPTKNHIIVLTSWKPGTLYSYKVIVKDLSGNETITKDYITLTPQTKESVVELIIKNFKEIFAWTGG